AARATVLPPPARLGRVSFSGPSISVRIGRATHARESAAPIPAPPPTVTTWHAVQRWLPPEPRFVLRHVPPVRPAPPATPLPLVESVAAIAPGPAVRGFPWAGQCSRPPPHQARWPGSWTTCGWKTTAPRTTVSIAGRF